MRKHFVLLLLSSLFASAVYAGNPDRQGEAGAYELLLNPWARSSGMHGLMTSNITGVEALRLNPAGLVRMTGNTQLIGAHTRYLAGSGLSITALGFAQKVGKNGSFGVEIMNFDFGDIPVTTTDLPEGNGLTFRPMFMNIGATYCHRFDKITTAVTMRIINERINNVGATGVCFDAGVQYVTGPKDNIKFGVSLRNIGTKMQYNGDALSFRATEPNGNYPLTVDRRAAGFEMPSQLNIGGSYDFLFGGDKQRFTTTFNFTANSFTRDQYGVGLEYAFREQFMLRAAYRIEPGLYGQDVAPNLENGLAAGASFEVPFKKDSKNSFGIDYSYRSTFAYAGTHTFGLRINL
jgi:hypothetical protein